MQLLAKGFLLIKDAKLLEFWCLFRFYCCSCCFKEEDVNTIVYTLPLFVFS
jgi:hypothetical protein